MRRNIVIGNWKMNGKAESSEKLVKGIADLWQGVHKAEVVVCPPFLYLESIARALDHSNIGVGAQNLSNKSSGAFTGEVSAEMLSDIGCQYVIVGHSERRQLFGESSALVAAKYHMACEHHITPILCVGETLEERKSGKAFEAVSSQLLQVVNYCGMSAMAKGIVAYEPVWAIGTGETASPDIAQEMHAYIREVLGPEGDQTRIIYGGSVKADNAADLFAQYDIDGALVGGASLDVNSFIDICRAAE